MDKRSAVANEDCIMDLAKFVHGSNAGTKGGAHMYMDDMRHYSQEIADKYQLLVPHLSPRTLARLLILVGNVQRRAVLSRELRVEESIL